MGLFNIFRKKREISQSDNVVSDFTDEETSQSNASTGDPANSTGKDFEFLITGDITISNEDFDNIMTPSSFDWSKIIKNNWLYYQVGNDELSYSFEPPGIQMTFNDEITYIKAKAIGDEVVDKINSTGQKETLVVLSKNQVYRFDM